MNVHIIENGVVINTIAIDSVESAEAHFPFAVCIDAAGGGSVGDTYSNGAFIKPEPPPAPVPQTVTMRQARLALLGAGLLQQVDAAIEAMPGVEGDAARIEWEYATSVERNSQLVAGLTGALGLTEQQLDALFVAAGGL